MNTYVQIQFIPHGKHRVFHLEVKIGQDCVGEWQLFIVGVLRESLNVIIGRVQIFGNDVNKSKFYSEGN